MFFESIRVSEIMTRDVLTVARTAPLAAAARLMKEHHVHCLVIPAAEGRCAGVITTKDLVQVLCEADLGALDQLTVADVMTAPAFGLQQDSSVLEGMKLMRMSGVRSAPVLDGTRLVGLLSFTDVVRAAVGR